MGAERPRSGLPRRAPTAKLIAWLGVIVAATAGITIIVIALNSPTWSIVAVDDPNAGTISSVSCSAGGLCMATGADNQVYTNRGVDGSWTVAAPLPGLSGGGDSLGGVACFAGGCVAATTSALYLTDPNASEWNLLWSAPSLWRVSRPTCARNGLFCMAFVDTYRSGSTSPGGHEAIVTIVNPKQNFGYGPTIAVHNETLYPKNWNGLWSGSCPTSTVCEGVSPNGVWRTTDRGAVWRLQLGMHAMFTGGGWEAVDCPSISTCYAGAGASNFAFTHDGGRTWRLVSTEWSGPANSSDNYASGSVNGIFCDTNSHCLAAVSQASSAPSGANPSSGYVLATSDGGRTWSQQAISVAAGLGSISCTDHLGCWTGGWSDVPDSNAGLLFHAAER